MGNSLTGVCIITVCNIRSLFDTILYRKHKGLVEKPSLTIFSSDVVLDGFTAFKMVIQLWGGGPDKAKQNPKMIFK